MKHLDTKLSKTWFFSLVVHLVVEEAGLLDRVHSHVVGPFAEVEEDRI